MRVRILSLLSAAIVGGAIAAGCSGGSSGGGGGSAPPPSGGGTPTAPTTAPTSNFTTAPNPANGPAPLAVTFNDTSTQTPSAWSWDFGDGSTSTQQNPSHTYQAAGTYTVTLVASNGLGQGTTQVRTGLVTVSAAGGGTGTGSPFWYENDAFGNPLKTHTSSEASLAAQVLTLVNQERANAGLPALQLDAEAERAAKAHAEDMAGRSFFAHNTPEGWTPTDRLTMLGASGYSGWGENIARGQSSPASVMTAWMNSTGHRENILRASFTHMGVGVDEATRHWVQVFTRR